MSARRCALTAWLPPSARTWAAGWPSPPLGTKAGATVRLKVDDGVIVFPVTAKGRKVSAEGVFEIVGNAGDAKDASEEHAKHDAAASRQYQLKATGAIIY